MKEAKRRQWRRSGVFIVNFEYHFTSCSSVSIINFEQVNAVWVALLIVNATIFQETWNEIVINTPKVISNYILI